MTVRIIACAFRRTSSSQFEPGFVLIDSCPGEGAPSSRTLFDRTGAAILAPWTVNEYPADGAFILPEKPNQF